MARLRTEFEDQWHRDERGIGGLSSICRACRSAGVGRMGEGGNANPYGKWQCA
jgi:hypothetical protein